MILQKNAAVTVDVFPQAFRRLIWDLEVASAFEHSSQIPNQLLATERLNGATPLVQNPKIFVGTLTAERTDPDPAASPIRAGTSQRLSDQQPLPSPSRSKFPGPGYSYVLSSSPISSSAHSRYIDTHSLPKPIQRDFCRNVQLKA